jgi:hypothetical protein
MYIRFCMFIILIRFHKSGKLPLLKMKMYLILLYPGVDITEYLIILHNKRWQSWYSNLREKKLQMNTVKMNGIDGWPTYAIENKAVYVGYVCFATLLIIWLKGCLLQIVTLKISFWKILDPLLYLKHRLSTAQKEKTKQFQDLPQDTENEYNQEANPVNETKHWLSPLSTPWQKWNTKPVVRQTSPLLTRHASYPTSTDRSKRFQCHKIQKHLCLENVVTNCKNPIWNQCIHSNGTNCIYGNSNGKAILI